VKVLPWKAAFTAYYFDFSCNERFLCKAHYALEGLSNNVMAAEYRITLPDEELLAAELGRTRQAIELRGSAT